MIGPPGDKLSPEARPFLPRAAGEQGGEKRMAEQLALAAGGFAAATGRAGGAALLVVLLALAFAAGRRGR